MDDTEEVLYSCNKLIEKSKIYPLFIINESIIFSVFNYAVLSISFIVSNIKYSL